MFTWTFQRSGVPSDGNLLSKVMEDFAARGKARECLALAQHAKDRELPGFRTCGLSLIPLRNHRKLALVCHHPSPSHLVSSTFPPHHRYWSPTLFGGPRLYSTARNVHPPHSLVGIPRLAPASCRARVGSLCSYSTRRPPHSRCTSLLGYDSCLRHGT